MTTLMLHIYYVCSVLTTCGFLNWEVRRPGGSRDYSDLPRDFPWLHMQETVPTYDRLSASPRRLRTWQAAGHAIILRNLESQDC